VGWVTDRPGEALVFSAPVTPDTPHNIGWGRVFPAARLSNAPATRRGAWYRVLSEGRSRVVLDIYGTRVALPKAAVEVRPQQPDRFTVVRRGQGETTPRRGEAGGDLSRVYAVCPRCAMRNALWGEPQELECDACHHKGVVAWWET
jgi:hypothetical protein